VRPLAACSRLALLIHLESEEGINRFVSATNAHWRRLKSTREIFVDHVKQFVGSWFGDNDIDEVLEPFITGFVETLCNNLAANDPVVSITTPIYELKTAAFEAGLVVNQAIGEMDLGRWFSRVLRNAMFGPGVMVIGISESARGFGRRRGDVFAEVVDPDDWIQDTNAAAWELGKFFGYRSREAIDELIEDESYDKEWRADLAKAPSNAVTDRTTEPDRARDIGLKRDDLQESEAEDCLDLWHFYLPREGLIATFVGETSGGDDVVSKRLVRLKEYNGPRTGPFEMLILSEVPGNPLPLPPVSKIRAIHDLLNKVAANNGEDADAEVSVLAVERTARKDADNILDAPRNGVATVDKLDKLKLFHYGGVQAANMQLQTALRSAANYHSGNPESLGGWSVQADTAKQEGIIKESASTQVGAIRIEFLKFAKRCLDRIAEYELTDPAMDRVIQRPLGAGQTMAMPVTAEHMEPLAGNFAHLNLRITPYSMESRTPVDKLRSLGELAGLIGQVAQAGAITAEQGIQPRYDGIIRVGAQTLGIDDMIEDFFDFQAEPSVPTQQARGGSDPRTPLSINRTNVKRYESNAQHQQGDGLADLAAQQQNDQSQLMEAAG
jgi:hypothetical protein